MSDASPTIHTVTDGGITADHSAMPVPPVLVAPSHSEKQHNTIRPALIPFACWRANDARFESSFVLPEIAPELKALKALIDRHTVTDDAGKPQFKPALTVFGHAEPTGSD